MSDDGRRKGESQAALVDYLQAASERSFLTSLQQPCVGEERPKLYDGFNHGVWFSIPDLGCGVAAHEIPDPFCPHCSCRPTISTMPSLLAMALPHA